MSPYVPAAVGAALALLPWGWGAGRYVVTLVHEAGHALVAVLTGRRLNGVRLHRDTSGLTTSVGRPTGPGMVATAAAGYLAPSALGLGLLALVSLDRTAWSLWVALAVVAGMLVLVRNGFGLVVVALAGAAVAYLVWRSDDAVQGFAALALATFLLVGGPRTTVELWSSRRASRSRTSDADVLARLTRVPAAAWNALFVVATVGTLVPAWTLLRDLAALR
jgi:hypothetical protein